MAQRLYLNLVTMIKYALILLFLFGLAVKGQASNTSTNADDQVWVDADGIKEKTLFRTSSILEEPIKVLVTVDDWTTVHTAADPQKARSKATFEIGDFKFDGAIQARGKSRFNLFSQRALRFEIGDKDYRLVSHFGSLKDKPKDSVKIQDARVLVEYTAYKMYEILSPHKSVKTRLAQIRFQNDKGATLDEGYAFFVEGQKAVGNRLTEDTDLTIGAPTTAFAFAPDSPGNLIGEIFRYFNLDQDRENMPNNYFYFGNNLRIPYDFDMSALAPPFSINKDSISGAREYFKTWLLNSYKAGSENMQLDLNVIKAEKNPARRKQLRAEYNQQLTAYQNEFKQALETFRSKESEIEKLFDNPRMKTPYRETQADWYRSALDVIRDFNP